MEQITIKSEISVYSYEELADDVRQLINKAKEATKNSYSPYSGFSVGAAVRLADSTIIQGANQENAAFSVTLCAERAAIFNAQSNIPAQAIEQIAIAAKNSNGFLAEPITPCGSCRQALLEIEQRYGRAIKIFLYGEKHIYAIDGIKHLLPLSFIADAMEK